MKGWNTRRLISFLSFIFCSLRNYILQIIHCHAKLTSSWAIMSHVVSTNASYSGIKRMPSKLLEKHSERMKENSAQMLIKNIAAVPENFQT
jgi:hypothetical protein